MKRAYVLGDSCASLGTVDFERLGKEATISCHGIGTESPESAFCPAYVLYSDRRLLERDREKIGRLIRSPRIGAIFLPDWSRSSFAGSEKIHFFPVEETQTGSSIQHSAELTAAVALKALGYEQIVLLGTGFQAKEQVRLWMQLSRTMLSSGNRILSASEATNLNQVVPFAELETVVRTQPSKLEALIQCVHKINSGIDGRWCGDFWTQLELCRLIDEGCQNLAEPRLFIEIGTLHGGSALAALLVASINEALDSVKVVCIDPLDGFYGAGRPDVVGQVSEDRVTRNLKKFGFSEKNFEVIPQRSNEVDISRFQGQKVGLLFIDGDHTYRGVKADWERYVELVDPEGRILFDNYAERIDPLMGNKVWPDVKEFVDKEVLTSPIWKIDSAAAEILCIVREGALSSPPLFSV